MRPVSLFLVAARFDTVWADPGNPSADDERAAWIDPRTSLVDPLLPVGSPQFQGPVSERSSHFAPLLPAG